VLEAIVLRNQIAVLERGWPSPPASVVLIGCFEFCCRASGRNGVKAWWSSSRRPSCASREVGVLSCGWPGRKLSLGYSKDSWRASHARFQPVPSHRIALSARTEQTADRSWWSFLGNQVIAFSYHPYREEDSHTEYMGLRFCFTGAAWFDLWRRSRG